LTKYNLGRKRLDVYFFNDKKYDLEEFREMILTDPELYATLVQKIIEKINPPGDIDVIDAQVVQPKKGINGPKV